MLVLKSVIRSGLSARCFSAGASSSFLKVNVNDKGVALVELNKPPVNTLCGEMFDQLHKTLLKLENEKCKGIILSSTHPTIFAAGLDIHEVYNVPADKVRKMWRAMQNAFIKLYSAPCPTVAALNGYSAAGGCLLAVACEYRMIVPQGKIGLNEIHLGIVPTEWFEDVIKSTIGDKLAERAFTSGTLYSAEQALEIGLVDEIATDKEDLLKRANKFMEEHISLPALARNTIKSSFRKANLTKLTTNLDEDTNTFVNFALQPSVQKNLADYVQRLAERKNKK